MKKFRKIILGLSLLLCVFILTGCGKEEEAVKNEEVPQISDATKFKEEYEKLNGTKNSSGEAHRTITIPEENPMVYAEAKDIVEKINNKETFYVYFGFSTCPWCRSVIEKALEVASSAEVDKIYYVDVLDIRDTLELDEDDKVVTTKAGTKDYYELIDLLDDVLEEYTLTNSKNKKIDTKEKRIYAPNFVYVKDGKPEDCIEGTSSKQKEARGELTDKILKDEEKAFKSFFGIS